MGITAIIPIHNEAPVLRRVLDSVERQSQKLDELIMVLDDCTDDSPSIARERSGRIVTVRERNTGAAVQVGASLASHDVLVLFDGNTLVPLDYVARMLEAFRATHPDLIEWHGGMMLIPRSTLDRYGKFSRMDLWTLEYFLRVESGGGRVVHLNGPFHRMKRSPLRRNIRYGLDYSELSERYHLAPFFRIGTKSGFLPDLFATAGALLGHIHRRQLRHALKKLPSAVRGS